MSSHTEFTKGVPSLITGPSYSQTAFGGQYSKEHILPTLPSKVILKSEVSRHSFTLST